MSGYTKTTILDCARSQSLEAEAFNNQNPAQWTNRAGTGIHLKVGDQITVHSSYISELGCQTGEIQIKGEKLSTTKTKITNYDNFLRSEPLPEKFALVNASNKETEIEIRDDTLNLIVSPYKTSNGENYMFLPRRFGIQGKPVGWDFFDQRERATATPGFGITPNPDLGQTHNPQRPLAICSADWIEVIEPYSASTATPQTKICQRNDNKRYTIFTREQTFRGDPTVPTLVLRGHSASGTKIITLTQGSVSDGIVKGMTLKSQTPLIAFPTSAKVVSVSTTNPLLITMSENASTDVSKEQLFEFSVPSGSAHLFLPPNVPESDYTADQCEAMRDPATFGNYIQVRDLVSTKVIPGYNSPTDIAIQLTEEINEKKRVDRLVYTIENNAKTQKEEKALTSISETDCYKHYHCATATSYQKSFFDEWFKVDKSGSVEESYNYLSNYQNIGIKRPEIYVAGCELNGSDGLSTEDSGETFQLESDQVFMTGDIWAEENLLKYKKLFDAQANYPELFDDYTQNASYKVSVDYNRFIHMNLFDNASQSYNPDVQFGPNFQRSPKVPGFGYDLYDSAISSSQTSFPLFIDYNINCSLKDKDDVSFTEFGNQKGSAGTMRPDYDDLAYGFARKVRRSSPFGPEESFYIGFQFTRTGNKIPEIFFNANASQANRKELGSGLGRTYGFDRHFSSYGNSAMILYNGNVDIYGHNRASDSQKIYAFGQQDKQKIVYLDPYQFGIYLGADNPLFNYDDTQQRFTLSALHQAEKVGNRDDAGFIGKDAVVVNPDADLDCYKINKRMLQTNYTPEMSPYVNQFNGSFAAPSKNASEETLNSMNTNIAQYTVFDANSGLFIEDWLCPETLWNQCLVGIMGYRYDQFHNPNSTSSRQVRIQAHGSSAELNNVNVITTNADVPQGNLIEEQRNVVDSNMFAIANAVAVGGIFSSFSGVQKDFRSITPAITISPAVSVDITAQRLPTKTLRPYYTIRSDILLENNYIGGKTSGLTLPIVSITNKANPYGDYLNGNGQITFTNTIDRVLTNVRCSIHEPDGSFARVDLDSAIIFKIDQQMPATLDLVSELLASKARADKKAAAQIEAIGSGEPV